MKTSYKIVSVYPKYTIIYEYWDDLLVYKYTIFNSYKGGGIEHFIINNDLCRIVIWEGLNEFHRRACILEL